MKVAQRVAIRTFGCQMNVHDSEKVANLLCHSGYELTDAWREADFLLINTCSIRGKAEHRLYSDLGTLRAWKEAAPGRVLGVGGCVAQQEGDAILTRFPQVDFVFGTHNLRLVPAMAEAARRGLRTLEISQSASPDRFDFPERHPAFAGRTPGRAYVTVMEGCDMFCSFCIVPRTRGREISRCAGDIVREAEALAADGVREITLLGQTVNAYGRHGLRRGRAGTVGFGALLRRLAKIPGIARLRYTSPHPLFFDEDLVRAHAELDALCPHVHLPLQSGSDAVLARMRRRYTADRYGEIVRQLRAARPDIAITTDIIVGFPGETEADFQATLERVREVAFVDSFSFKYSVRPGTAAATLDGAVDPERAQERLEALHALQRSLTLKAHQSRVGERTEILVEGESRRGGGQYHGRDPYHRIVNFPAGELAPSEGKPAQRARSEPKANGGRPLPGRMLQVRIAEATPHSLIGQILPDGSQESLQDR